MQTLHATPPARAESRPAVELQVLWALGPEPVVPRRSLVAPLLRGITLQFFVLIVLFLGLASGKWLLLLPNLLVGVAMVSVLDVFNAFRRVRGLVAVNCLLAVVVAQIGIPVLMLSA